MNIPIKQYRWLVVVLFALLIGVQQIAVVGLAPLIPLLQQRYGISELWAGMSYSVLPLCWLVVGLHSSAAVDRYGYRFTVTVGGLMLVLGVWCRVLELGYAVLFLGQMLIGFSQPFILNSWTKLVLDWFSSEEAGAAIGFCAFVQLMGATVGIWLVPWLVSTYDFGQAMLVISVAVTIIFLAYALIVRENNRIRLSRKVGMIQEMKACLANAGFGYLCAMSFCFFGAMNGVLAWYATIKQPAGLTYEDAGLVLAVLSIAGGIGAFILPILSDFFKRRKPFIGFSYLVTAIFIFPLFYISELRVALLIAGVFGLMLFGAWSVMLIMTEEIVGPEKAGMALGIFLLVGMGGWFVTVNLMPLLKVGNDWTYGILLMMFELLSIPLLMLKIRETYKPKAVAISDTCHSV